MDGYAYIRTYITLKSISLLILKQKIIQITKLNTYKKKHLGDMWENFNARTFEFKGESFTKWCLLSYY